MKFALATIACAAITIATVAAQAQNPPTPPTTNPQSVPEQTPKPDVTMTGCVIQGSAPTVFLFDNARKNPKDKTEKASRYLLVAVGEDLPLRSNLNHEVELVGQAETKTLPTGKVEEKDLPKFSAKSLTLVSNTCPAAGTR